MFKRNDYSAVVWMIILIAFFVTEIIASFVVGIYVMAKTTEEEKYWIGVGFAVIFGGVISSAVLFMFFRLILSFICDIKLIRNKLYEEDNANLRIFFKPLKNDILRRKNAGKIENEKVNAEKITDNKTATKVKRKNKINIFTVIISISSIVAFLAIVFILIILLIQ